MIKKVSLFGGGLRFCSGIELAKVEAAVFFYYLVFNYKYYFFRFLLKVFLVK